MNMFKVSSLILSLLTISSHAAIFKIENNCEYTVWAAASPGGGRQLDHGQVWELSVPVGTPMARIWGRTKCNFDANGKGQCETGDCNGLLQCNAWGKPPQTLAEYTLTETKDTYDISLIEGFNIPMDFGPTQPDCHMIKCSADINGQCPTKLKTIGGCNNPCTVFNKIEYCCTPQRGSCGPTEFSKFFKGKCPDAYSFPQDDQTSTFSCNTGTNYRVVFCPGTV